jgi:hypothetical protein
VCDAGRSKWYENFCTGKILGRLDRMGYLIFPHLVDYDISHGKTGRDTHPDWWSDDNLINTDRLEGLGGGGGSQRPGGLRTGQCPEDPLAHGIETNGHPQP